MQRLFANALVVVFAALLVQLPEGQSASYKELGCFGNSNRYDRADEDVEAGGFGISKILTSVGVSSSPQSCVNTCAGHGKTLAAFEYDAKFNSHCKCSLWVRYHEGWGDINSSSAWWKRDDSLCEEGGSDDKWLMGIL